MYPSVQWSSVILVEPMYSKFQNSPMTLANGANKRRDVWSSREEAYKHFRERSFKSWDPRLIDIHAVRICLDRGNSRSNQTDRDTAYENSQP